MLSGRCLISVCPCLLYLPSFQLQLGGWGKDRKEAEETVPYLRRDLGDMTLAVAHLKLDPTYSVGVCGVPESEWKITNPLVILTCALSWGLSLWHLFWNKSSLSFRR